MNIMNLNDLVAAAREETFLGDITWNIAVFCRLISISICIYWILCSTVLQLFTHGTPKRQIKSKMKLEKAAILRCSLKDVLSKLLGEQVYRSLFFNEVTHSREAFYNFIGK